MADFFNNLIQLSLEAAPWLVLGLVIGGLVKTLIPTDFLQKHLKGSKFSNVVKAALLGAPLPLCSCGVIPAALGLRKAGASKPATVSFLVATPETGVDSISVSYALLGPFIAIARPIAAITSAITAGLLVGKTEENAHGEKVMLHAHEHNSCCENGKTEENDCCSSEIMSEESCCPSESTTIAAQSCCGTDTAYQQPTESFARKSWSGIQYAFTQLLDDIIVWLVIGLVFAALIKTFLPATFLADWGSGLPAMIVMILIGIPMYVCATASTPIAAGLIMAGISPGTALVFLMAGPATNVSTLGIIVKELGRRSLLAYLTGVCVVALISGLTLDYLIGYWSIDIQAQLHAGAHLIPHAIAWMALIILIAMALRHLLNPGKLLVSISRQ